MGVVHHAAYVPWLEIGRTELMREAGLSYADMERAGLFLVIVKMTCRYAKPGRYDDLVEVRTRVSGGSRVKIEHEYELFRVDESRGGTDASAPGQTSGVVTDLLVTASTTLACVDGRGKVVELPAWLAPGSLA